MAGLSGGESRAPAEVEVGRLGLGELTRLRSEDSREGGIADIEWPLPLVLDTVPLGEPKGGEAIEGDDDGLSGDLILGTAVDDEEGEETEESVAVDSEDDGDDDDEDAISFGGGFELIVVDDDEDNEKSELEVYIQQAIKYTRLECGNERRMMVVVEMQKVAHEIPKL